MEPWILLAVAAAFFQTLRFMLQKRMTISGISATAATFARFVYSAPIAVVAVVVYLGSAGVTLPQAGGRFWAFAFCGGLAQILATVCVVALFRHRNFAVGITFKKTEVLMTAAVGYAVLGDAVSTPGGLALLLGLMGVLWLSVPAEGRGKWRDIVNPAAGLGVLSGAFFAVSAVGYRGAILALDGGDATLRPAFALALVTVFQSLGMAVWLRMRDPGQITRVLTGWRRFGAVGVLSFAGSLCWFAAFSIQNAAYVFAVGQVEIIFSIIASVLAFGETLRRKEAIGILLITVSIVALALFG